MGRNKVVYLDFDKLNLQLGTSYVIEHPTIRSERTEQNQSLI